MFIIPDKDPAEFLPKIFFSSDVLPVQLKQMKINIAYQCYLRKKYNYGSACTRNPTACLI